MDMTAQQAPQMPQGEEGLQLGQPGQPQMPNGPQMPGGPAGPMGQPQGPMGMQPTEADPSEAQTKAYIDYAMENANLAKKFEDQLDDVAQEVLAGIEADETSRQDWMDKNEEWLKLALLIREGKSFPWPKASNVKYPLIATAAMQFSARAYPALVPNDGKVVKARVSGADPQGLFEQKALRVAIHMSYQVSCQIPNWEENMDKLLMTMAVSGICFKKTWHDQLLGVHRSELLYPEDLIVNYYAKSLETAFRKTEVLYYTDNEIFTKIKAGEFLNLEDKDYEDEDVEHDLGSTSTEEAKPMKEAITVDLTPPPVDKSTPHKFFACHTYYDLDEDGYAEPYIITVHKASSKVVRIVARWDSDGIIKADDGKQVIHIKPVEYFTDFPFIPNADGSIYAMGFGMLMGPLNEAVNTLVNQLIDAGTLNTLSGGFVGKNLRIKMGQLKISPGEWKVVNAGGEDMQKSFYPIPTKEPSPILFSLLQFLVTSGNQLASIAEIFVGKMPGQNTPATTTQETIQQGMAVFTAIYKRVYRSLSKEFKKIFRLNRITPGMMEEEIMYAGQPLTESDYQGTEMMIIPGADPTGDSATVRQQKLQMVGQLIPLGTINPMVYTQRLVEAFEIPNSQELIAQPQPPAPDPKMETEKMKQQTMMMNAEMKKAENSQKMEHKQEEASIKNIERQMDLAFEEKMNALKLQGEANSHKMSQIEKTTELNHKQMMAILDKAMTAIQNKDTIAHERSMNAEKLRTQKAVTQQKAKAKPSGNK